MARTVTFEERRAAYSRLLGSMQVRSNWTGAVDRAARYALKHKQRYQTISLQTGIPWDFIACLHWRESSGSFTKHLHNGDPLTRRTVRVPAGRPRSVPPFTWEESALDALRMKGLHRLNDWSMERICYEAERYNGFGYFLYRGIQSPYLWGGTTHYSRGGYVRDGVYSPTAVNKQVGVIPMLLRIRELDVRERVVQSSRKLTTGRRVMNTIKAFFAAIASLFTFETLGVVREWVSFADLFDPKLMVVLGIATLAIFVLVKWYENLTLEDFKQHRYTPSGSVFEGDPDERDPDFPSPLADGLLNEDAWGDHSALPEREADRGRDRGGSAQGRPEQPDLFERAADGAVEGRNPE